MFINGKNGFAFQTLVLNIELDINVNIYVNINVFNVNKAEKLTNI